MLARLRRSISVFVLAVLALIPLCLPGPALATGATTAGSYNLSVKAVEGVGTAPAAGTVLHDWSYSTGFTAGTTAGTIDLAYSTNISLGASASTTIDLRSLTDQDGTAVTFVGVVCIAVKNTGTVEIDIGNATSNAWTGLLSVGTTLYQVKGGALWVHCSDTAVATTTGSKDVKILNTSGSTAATATITILGRSA